jgi:hypothetical protein
MDCPDYLIKTIRAIAHRVCLEEWSSQNGLPDFGDPTQNTGENWANDTFSFYAYSWDEDGMLDDTPNFKFGDIKVTWYKRLGRGTEVNREVTIQECKDMFDSCMESLID